MECGKSCEVLKLLDWSHAKKKKVFLCVRINEFMIQGKRVTFLVNVCTQINTMKLTFLNFQKVTNDINVKNCLE